MPTIIRMNRYGRVWRILLDCGHTLERTPEQINEQQLYVGKRIGCGRCEEQTKEN